jgi:hypothetical protein
MCHVVAVSTYTGDTSLWECLASEGQNCNLIPVLTEKGLNEIKI